MTLFHGSYMEVRKPDISHSRANLDFGKGFYTTTIYEQAEKWCSRFKRKGGIGVISYYTFDDAVLDASKVLRFDTYSDEWLDFILRCRNNEDTTDYDIVIGGIANDKVFNTIELYFDQLISKDEAIKRLRFEEPNMQLCIRGQAVINSYLHFDGSIQI